LERSIWRTANATATRTTATVNAKAYKTDRKETKTANPPAGIGTPIGPETTKTEELSRNATVPTRTGELSRNATAPTRTGELNSSGIVPTRIGGRSSSGIVPTRTGGHSSSGIVPTRTGGHAIATGKVKIAGHSSAESRIGEMQTGVTGIDAIRTGVTRIAAIQTGVTGTDAIQTAAILIGGTGTDAIPIGATEPTTGASRDGCGGKDQTDTGIGLETATAVISDTSAD
jgi:hypothetical protein